MKSDLGAGLVLAFCLAACSDGTRTDSSSQSAGTVVIATNSDVDALFPPTALSLPARQATELIYEYLADVGPAMNTLDDATFTKELASSWTWNKDSSAITFKLNPKARWHDGTPVTSKDVAFSFSVYSDTLVSSSGVSELSDIDSVTAPDYSTAIFWFKRNTSHQFYDAASLMLILPEHVFGKIQHDSLKVFAARTEPVGSGMYKLTSWKTGSSLELGAVKDHYRGTPNISRVIWSVIPEYKSAVMQLLGGSVDLFENLRLETVPQMTDKSNYNIVSLPGMDYVFMRFNLRDPSGSGAPHALFASRDMRRAVTMLIDRRSLVKNLFDTLAVVGVGPTVRAFPETDTAITAIPFDTLASARLLDSLGWKLPAGGRVRQKNGKPLRFTVLVPVSSLSRMRISVLIQEELRRHGIDMHIEQMDLTAFNARQEKRSFDAAIGGWHLGSHPGGVKETWTSTAAEKGGLNYGGYRNAEFDSLIDSAMAARELGPARDFFRKAHQLIMDDAPAVWLYEPRTLIAVHRRIKTTPMRPSAWWVGLGNWSIPEAERIPRDAQRLSK